MRVSAAAISICLALFLSCGGCSNEEPPPVQKAKVVKPIRRPIPEKTKMALPDHEAWVKDGAEKRADTGIPTFEEEALKTPEPVDRIIVATKKQRTGYPLAGTTPGKVKTSLDGIEADFKAEAKKREDVWISPFEKEALKTPEPVDREIVATKKQRTGYDLVPPTPERSEKPADIGIPPPEEKALKTLEPFAEEEVASKQKMAGYYTIENSDSLSGIAARKDVYGDALKWPVLYRLNVDKLGVLQLEEDFLNKQVPAGLSLRIVSPDEAQANLDSRTNKAWVVNVLSTTTYEKIVPAAIKLIKNGYTVYITRARVKGKDWMRLRVGFFKKSSEADTEGQKIKVLLNLDDSWTTKIAKKELKEFGSY